jgi:type IX secretion system PorP/SprF family membrane protein
VILLRFHYISVDSITLKLLSCRSFQKQMSVRGFILGVFMILCMGKLLAQQDPQFTQYMFNTIYYNPAAAGSDGVTKFSALHRSQWLGYESSFGGGGAPTTQLISASAPLFKINSGIGGYVVSDRLGPQTNLEAQVSYAYHRIIKGSKISIGIRTGLFSQAIDFDKYIPIDPNDPLLNKTGKESQVRPDMAIGVFFQREKYYAGVSLNHMIKSTFDFGLNQRNALEPHLYITGGYFYDINLDLKLQFVSLIKTDLVKTTFDVGAIAFFKDTMWGGLSLRQAEGPTLLLGYSFLKDKSLRAGYALDYVVSGQEAKAPTSHEFMVTYVLPATPVLGKKIIRTPRYRH